jgi:hypothetical protein
MSLTVTINDTTGVGKITNTINVSFRQELVTIRDIIAARVEKEVSEYNNKKPDYFLGLVQPTHAERTLNGYKMKERKHIDAEKQVYIALDSFMKNAYFILIDNKQAETLDQEVKISTTSNIRFVKLTPLVGG